MQTLHNKVFEIYRNTDSLKSRCFTYFTTPTPLETRMENEDKPEIFLENPATFGLRHLRILEKKAAAKNITESEKQKFRNIVEYFLEVGDDLLNKPPHRMVGEIMKRPKLVSFLSPKAQKKLEIVVNNRVKQLREILKKSEQKDSENAELKSTDVLRIVNLYKHVEGYKEFGIMKDGRPHPVLSKTMEVLVGEIGKLLKKFKDNPTPGSLSNKEIMLCLEVRRLFPDQKEWGIAPHANLWKDFSAIIAKKITPTSDSDITEILRDPEMSSIWDILNDLSETDDPDYAALRTTEVKDRIRNLLELGNGVPLLHWAEHKNEFRPIELKSLIHLANKDPRGLDFIKELGLLEEEVEKINEKIQKINEKINEKKEIIEHFKDSVYEEKRNDPDDANAKEYHLAKEETKAKYEEIFKNYTVPTILNLETAINATTPIDMELQNRSTEALNDANDLMADSSGDDYLEKAKDVIAEIEDIYKQTFHRKIIVKDTPEHNQYLLFLQETKEVKELAKKMEAKDVAIRESVSIPEEIQNKIKEEQKRISELRIKRNKLQNESVERKVYIKNFVQSKVTANEKIADYKGKLVERITRGGLSSSDIQVLLAFEENGLEAWFIRENILSAAIKDNLRAIRTTTQNYIISVAQNTDGQTIEELVKALTPQSIKDALTNAGITTTEIFDKTKSEQSFAQGVIKYHLHTIAEHRNDPEDIQILDQILNNNQEAINTNPGETENPAEMYDFIEKEKREFEARLESLHPNKLKYLLEQYSTLSATEQYTLIQNLNQKTYSRGEILKILNGINWDEEPPGWNSSKMADKLMLQGSFEGGFDRFYVDFKNIGEINLGQISKAIEATQAQTTQLQKIIVESQKQFLSFQQNVLNGKTDIDEIHQEIETTWKVSRSQILALIITMQSRCSGIFPDQINQKLFESIRDQFMEKIDNNIDFLVRTNDGNHHAWSDFEQNLNQLLSTYDFRNGQFGKQAKKQKEVFKDHNKGLAILEKNGFFEDETENKEKFKVTFQKVQAQFSNAYSHYQEKYRKVMRVMKYDLEQYKNHPEEFEIKYPEMSYEYAQNLVEMYDKQSLKLDDLAQRFGNDSKKSRAYFNQWMEKYNESNEARAEALRELQTWEQIGDFAKNAQQDIVQFENYLSAYEKYKKGMPFFSFESRKLEKYLGKPGRQVGNALLDAFKINPRSTYQTFSLSDTIRIINQIIETNQLRMKRQSDRAVANIGVYLFSERNIYGKEFKRLGEDSEGKRVSEFESQYGDSEGWDILDQLYQTKDADEARALINLATQKGFLKWDDPKLWRTLMKLQSDVQFFIPEDANLPMDAIREKVKRACAAIWSQDVFDNWQAGFDGNLSSAKGRFSLEFMTMANSGGLDGVMSTMLQRWKSGETEDINPAQFEHFLFEAWDQGKMNGVPDRRWYYFIQGLTLRNPDGQTILSRETIDRVNGTFLARIPMFDFLVDSGSNKYNGRVVPEGHPYGERRQWTIEDFRIWADMMGSANGTFHGKKGNTMEKVGKFYYHIVIQSEVVQGRVERMHRIAEKENDHDDAAAFSPFWSADKLAQAMARDSAERDKHTPSFHRNFMNGFKLYFEEMHQYIQNCDAEYGSASWWQDERKKLLLQIGESLRTAMTGIMIIQGNNAGVGERPSIFSDTDIEKKDGLAGVSFAEARTDIFGFMDTLLDVKEKDPNEKQEFKRLMRMRGNKYSTDWRVIKNKLENDEKGVVDKLRAVVSSNYEEGGKYYHDPDAIWQAMQQIYG